MGIPTGFSLDVVLCPAHPLRFPSRLASRTHRPLLAKAVTQSEVKPQESSIGEQKELVKTGRTSKPSTSKQSTPSAWSDTMESSGVFGRSPLSCEVGFFPQLLLTHPGWAVGRLLGGVNTARSAASSTQQDGAGRQPGSRAGGRDKAKFSHVPLAIPQRLVSFREHGWQ